MLRNSCVAERLTVSQQGLSSTELVRMKDNPVAILSEVYAHCFLSVVISQCCQHLDRTWSIDRMIANGELTRIRKEAVVGYSRYYARIFWRD
jgi:hypothetical protein